MLSRKIGCFVLVFFAVTAAGCRDAEGPPPPTPLRVLNGIDMLERENFHLLQGKRIGLITNHSGLTSDGRRTVEVLATAPGVTLAALFSPEHGLDGKLLGRVDDAEDSSTGLRIYSLYGETRRPTPEMLAGLDVLVFDLQDVGVRYYTYASTMAYAMEEAARAGIEFIVLDRLNPIGGEIVEGPMLDPDRLNFEGYFPLPLRHGMTLGELALLFNAENGIGAKLTVVQIRGWQRTHWYWQIALWESQSGRTWVKPSPNIRSGAGNAFYPAVELLRAGEVSVGRGTETPFELFGAPWIDADKLASYLNGRDIPGVLFEPIRFLPVSDVHADTDCQGVRLQLIDQNAFRVGRLGMELLAALHKLYPDDFKLPKTIRLVGSAGTLERLERGDDPRDIVAGWQEGMAAFAVLRAKHLLYD